MLIKIIFYILPFFISLSFAGQEIIILKLSGKVELFSMNKWNPAKVGDIISTEDKIRTGKASYCIILFQDGHKIRICEKSEISISSIIPKKIELKLFNGRVRAKVSKLAPEGTFNIITPTAVCAVRGTDFAVEYREGTTKLEVYEGIVFVKDELTRKEILVDSGKFIIILPDREPGTPKEIPKKDIQIKQQEDIEMELKEEKNLENELKTEAQREIFQEISMEQVRERADKEIKLAEYQNGKSVIDVSGNRVRVEEYIVRSQKNQFKYVVLNTRENRFDFGKILFTFNKDLPRDLREATKNMFEYYGPQKPEYILVEVDSVLSNTVDQINEHATGGDMFPDNPANPSYWRHYFTNYNFYLNNKLRWKYEATVSGDRISKIRLSYYDKNGNVISPPSSTFDMPTGLDALHFREKNTYSDGVWIAKDSYVIDDNGKIIKADDLKNWTSTDVTQKASQLNFELVYTSNEFTGPEGKIDLVYSAKLLSDSGILSLPGPAEKLTTSSVIKRSTKVD